MQTQVVATACLFLAGKVEDTPRSLHRISEHMYEAFCKDFSRVSAATAKARWEDMVSSSTSPANISSQMKASGARYKPKALTADLTLLTLQAYQENFKAAVLAAERSLLFTLGFNFRIDTPHKCLLHELQGVAKSLKAPIEQACASAAAADLQPSHVQQAAYDVCNERYVPVNTLPYTSFLLHIPGLCLANVSTSLFLCCLTCTLVKLFLCFKVWTCTAAA